MLRTVPTRAWLFLGGALAVLLGARILTAGAVPLTGVVQDAATLAIGVLIESTPFVVLGILFAVIVQVWLPASWLDRVLPRTPWLRRASLALLGIVMPVCECGNVPLARGLMVRGAKPAEAITLLAAAPILNPVTIVTTYQAFGWDHGILIARIVGGYLLANLIGWSFARRATGDVLTTRFQASCEVEAPLERRRVRESAALVAHESQAVLPALVIGAMLAALVQTGVPTQLLTEVGQHPLLSIAALVTLAGIVSICSSVDAFFALAFASTFTPGAIVAFLVFGPMLDIKMAALMSTTFTPKTIVQFGTIALLGAITLGLAVNAIV